MTDYLIGLRDLLLDGEVQIGKGRPPRLDDPPKLVQALLQAEILKSDE